MTFLDTDILVDVLRKLPQAIAWLKAAVAADAVGACGFTALELIEGCRNSADQREVEQLLSTIRLIWPSSAHCQLALDSFRSLHLSRGLDALDALIAQTAIELQLPLHTFNVKHFQHVTGLTTIQPYTR